MSEAELPPVKEPVDYARVLANRVSSELGGGWHVESQSEFQAVLVRPGTRVNHILHLILSILTLGLWLIVWVWIAFFKKREHHKVIQVDAFGNVSVVSR